MITLQTTKGTIYHIEALYVDKPDPGWYLRVHRIKDSGARVLVVSPMTLFESARAAHMAGLEAALDQDLNVATLTRPQRLMNR